MNNISFGAGTLFIGSPDEGFQRLGDVEEIVLPDGPVRAEDLELEDLSLSDENTFTITLTRKESNAFFENLLQIRELVLYMVQCYGYPQIAHLAKHARKHRTRKKNFSRAYRTVKNGRVNHD